MRDADCVYIFVRTDIPVADQIVQVAHAAIEGAKQFKIPDHCHVVVLAVEDLHEMNISMMRIENRVKFITFYETDDDMGYTAVCTEPVSNTDRIHFKRFKMWTT